jgi:hypothetical protein
MSGRLCGQHNFRDLYKLEPILNSHDFIERIGSSRCSFGYKTSVHSMGGSETKKHFALIRFRTHGFSNTGQSRIGLQESHGRLADLNDRTGFLDSFVQFMTEKKVFGKVGGELFHAAEGPLGRQIFQSVLVQTVPDFRVSDFQRRMPCEFAEYPGLPGNAATQHNTRERAEIGWVILDILQRADISVADYRQFCIGGNPGKFLPPCAPLELFRGEAGMNGDGVNIEILEESQPLQEGFSPSLRVIAQAAFHCESALVAGPDPLQNLLEALEIPEQRSAGCLMLDLRGGAAEIQINGRRILSLKFRKSCFDVLFARNAQLVNDESFTIPALGECGLSRVLVEECRCREHLRGECSVSAEIRQ